ncbi:hypothetical protein LINGRAHAP2_LOCUS10875, partial [Linum grandiflorum]
GNQNKSPIVDTDELLSLIILRSDSKIERGKSPSALHLPSPNTTATLARRRLEITVMTILKNIKLEVDKPLSLTLDHKSGGGVAIMVNQIIFTL